MVVNYTDKKYDHKIGTIDLETYASKENGLGDLEVYAAGCAMSDGYKEFYYIDKNQELNSGYDLIYKMVNDIFDHINGDIKVRNNYTFYAHNLGRFDSVFVLKSLGLLGSNYKVTASWQENDLLSIKIKDTERKISIKILDSIKLIPSSLDKILKSFDCQINKGIFPHMFINSSNLNYIGHKPNIKYYIKESKLNDINKALYNEIPDVINIKQQCLEYLEKDVLGLLEAMNMYSRSIYNEYKLNITKYQTLPSLSLAIYGYWYFNTETPIKMIKGPLEKFIRNAYFGGNSNIFVEGDDRIVTEGLHYDLNSQFPAAMKESMPTGNPVFSNNPQLSYYKLGFVFAKIIPPRIDTLKNLFIQRRNEDGSVSCPREPFYEYISTVDLHQGIKYGYKAEIICGVNFPDACESNILFGEFVDTLYEKKSNASDGLQRTIAKLILNSTYGKFGQKDYENTIKLLNHEQADKIISKHHVHYFAQVGLDTVIVKYGPKLHEKLRKLYKYMEEEESINVKYNFVKERGTQSAVQISAMISSHARVSINSYKNIPGNEAIASNTDSLILKHPLPDDVVNSKLGGWKLEHKFVNGIFVKPKLYCYTDANTQKLIRKASGVDSSQLTLNNYKELLNGIDVLTNKEIFKIE